MFIACIVDEFRLNIIMYVSARIFVLDVIYTHTLTYQQQYTSTYTKNT